MVCWGMRKWKYLFLHCCDVCSNILPLLSCIPSRRSITTCWQRKSTRFKRNWRKRGGHDSRSRAWCQANLALPPQASHRVLRAWGSRPWPQGNPQVSKHTVLPPSHTSLNVHRCTWRHAQNCCPASNRKEFDYSAFRSVTFILPGMYLYIWY